MAGATQGTQGRIPTHRETAGQGAVALGGTLALGALLAVLLWRLTGPPRVPSGLPAWAEVRAVLTATELSDAQVIAAASAFAWLLLAYLALTIGLRFLAALAERVSGGARWARTALRLTHLVTIPAVRRLVDGGVAGTLLLASWLPDTSRAAAAAEPPPVVSVQAAAFVPSMTVESDRDAAQRAEHRSAVVEYTVVRGDSLWGIAQRMYGDGGRYVELFEGNRDRVMPGGERLSDPRLIRPGWTLQLPLPTRNLVVDQERASYRVARGDDLWTIAERFLGDGFRWVEIWERNREREMGGGWRFTNPDLIHPGWLLELPLTVREFAPGPSAVAPSTPIAPAEHDGTPAAETPFVPVPAPAAGGEEVAPRADERAAWEREWPSLPGPVLVTAAGFVLLGGAALFVHRLQRRGLLALRRGGARAARSFGDAARVVLATRALGAALAEYGLGEARLLLVRESRDRLAFTVECAPGDAEALAARRDDLARWLSCMVEAEVVGATRVELTLAGLRRLVASLAAEPAGGPGLVVPVGADAEGIVYLNLAAAGSVAVAGGAGERRQLLRSWATALATTHGADELALRADAAGAALLGLVRAPHLAGPAGEQEGAAFAEELDEIVQARTSGSAGLPLVALMELAAPVDGILAAVLRDGPPTDVFVVAGTEDVGAFAAAMTLGGTAPAEDEDGDEGATPAGAITLRLPGGEELALDPIRVRRDDSPRWRESAAFAEAIADGGSPQHVMAVDEERDDEADPPGEETNAVAAPPPVHESEPTLGALAQAFH